MTGETLGIFFTLVCFSYAFALVMCQKATSLSSGSIEERMDKLEQRMTAFVEVEVKDAIGFEYGNTHQSIAE